MVCYVGWNTTTGDIIPSLRQTTFLVAIVAVAVRAIIFTLGGRIVRIISNSENAFLKTKSDALTVFSVGFKYELYQSTNLRLIRTPDCTCWSEYDIQD